MQDIIKKVHAHMPYHLLPKYMEMVLKHKLNLEIYFHHWALQNMDKVKCKEMATILTDAGLKTTFHAPFMDLRTGALDDKIRRASIDRIKEVFEVVPYFRPLKIVCHASFDERYYVLAHELWLEASVKTWKELTALSRDHETIIALENAYEKSPEMLRRLFDALSPDNICFCFDTGHFNVFSYEPLSVWMKELGKYLGHLHLHDNQGHRDEHLPVGYGTFPFREFLQLLHKMKVKPTITLEAHNPDNLWASMNNIKNMGLAGLLDKIT